MNKHVLIAANESANTKGLLQGLKGVGIPAHLLPTARSTMAFLQGRCGPKWPKERSPGSTLGSSPLPNSPEAEGAMRYGDNRLGNFEPDRVHISNPFRAKRLFSTNPGLSYFGHFGPRIINVQTPGPGFQPWESPPSATRPEGRQIELTNNAKVGC
jgi:hypothetical protein